MRAYLTLLALSPVCVMANGGPVAWSSPSGRGDVAPIKVGDVRLVAEKLVITVDDAGDGYAVDATYTLENSSPRPVRLTYGVPLTWVPDAAADNDGVISPEQALRAKGLASYPDAVHLRLDGERKPCKLEGVTTSRSGSDGAVQRFEGWCVTELEVPVGARVTLTLQYPGAFEYTDWAYSKSAFKEFGKRRLEYLLSPAAGWRGPPELVEIDLDGGRWIDDVVSSSPAGSSRDGSKLRWRLVKPDLKALSAVVVVIDGTKKRQFRERVSHEAPVRRLTAEASSTLAPRGRFRYEAANVLDGDPKTAWCAGKTQGGTGAWIELKAEWLTPMPYCRLQGFTLVPGYARDQATYRRNNRIVAVRIEKCGAEEGDSREVVPPDRADEAFVDLAPTEGLRWILEKARSMCVRLTVERVEQGPDKDTCISEFRPFINCG